MDTRKIIFLEAESFDNLGGWVIDQQFMDIMGSPYLLAHGLGVPVEDAETMVSFPETGKYRMWARTMDWVAHWNVPGSPGKFQVSINDEFVKTILGTEGKDWHWQDGGIVEIKDKKAKVKLHDLTGFEGRCDAVLFSSHINFLPPNSGKELADFRKKSLGLSEIPENVGDFDLVVIGAGIAGICAAVSGARLGLKVALIQDRPVLGGNNSSEVRVWLGGEKNLEPYPRVGDLLSELEQARRAHYGPENTPDLYEDEKKLAIVNAENISLFPWHRVNEVITDSGIIKSVIAQDVINGKRISFSGKWFADCTGDGCVGFLAGADYDINLEGHMGQCNNWNIIDTGKPITFPQCPWAYNLSQKPFPGRSDATGQFTDRGIKSLGGWYWESGFDHDPIAKDEYIRDNNFRAMYGAWDCLKNVDKAYPAYKLNWCSYVSGKRESRRLLGDIILTQEHLMSGHKFPDGCVPTGWDIDLHLPHESYQKGFEGNEFISKAIFTKYPRPYWLPYRCLYSRNIGNLFMAGRDVSVTHDALGAVRVMRTGGLMGEIVGMAAWVCNKRNTTPRGVYENFMDDLKETMKKGVGKGLHTEKLEK